jgi:hypothetical protein
MTKRYKTQFFFEKTPVRRSKSSAQNSLNFRAEFFAVDDLHRGRLTVLLLRPGRVAAPGLSCCFVGANRAWVGIVSS